MLAQRVGPVTIDFSEKREDLSVVTVPEDCVGYVMGRGGQALRGMEEEWGTLMFFAKARRLWGGATLSRTRKTPAIHPVRPARQRSSALAGRGAAAGGGEAAAAD